MTSVTKGMGTALLWNTSGGGFTACQIVATGTVFDLAARGMVRTFSVSLCLILSSFRFFFLDRLTSIGFRNI